MRRENCKMNVLEHWLFRKEGQIESIFPKKNQLLLQHLRSTRDLLMPICVHFGDFDQDFVCWVNLLCPDLTPWYSKSLFQPQDSDSRWQKVFNKKSSWNKAGIKSKSEFACLACFSSGARFSLYADY